MRSVPGRGATGLEGRGRRNHERMIRDFSLELGAGGFRMRWVYFRLLREHPMGFRVKETDLVRSCLDWLALHRIMAWRSNNTGIFDPAKKVFRTFHGRKGVADLLGVFSQTVELKDGTNVT